MADAASTSTTSSDTTSATKPADPAKVTAATPVTAPAETSQQAQDPDVAPHEDPALSEDSPEGEAARAREAEARLGVQEEGEPVTEQVYRANTTIFAPNGVGVFAAGQDVPVSHALFQGALDAGQLYAVD